MKKIIFNRKTVNDAVILLVASIMILSTVVAAYSTDKQSSKTILSAGMMDYIPQPQQANMFDGDWIHFDDGINCTGVGLYGGGTFEAAIRITPDELGDYDDWHLTVVKFCHYEEGTHSGDIKIYEDGTSTSPGALITSESYTVTGADWFEIPLSSPVVLDAAKDIWVSVNVTHEAWEYPIGTDEGPAIDGKGDWIEYGSGWKELQYMDLDYNWCIWAKVEDCSDVEIEISGGFGVTAVVRNTGEEDIINLEWNITLDGGLILFGREKTGIVENLPVGDDVTIRSFVFGLGRPTINVTVSCTKETASGLVILFFVMEVQ